MLWFYKPSDDDEGGRIEPYGYQYHTGSIDMIGTVPVEQEVCVAASARTATANLFRAGRAPMRIQVI